MAVLKNKSGLRLSINPTSGAFTGAFLADPAKRTVATGFSGVVYQKIVAGAGVFIGSTHAGNVTLIAK
jgi:hypothetical protein